MIPLQSFASAGLSGRLHWFQHPWAMGMTAAKPKALTRADLENIMVVVLFDCECVSVLQNFRAREKRVRTGNIQTLVRRQSVGICERARSLVDYPRHSEQKCFWSLACLMLTKMAASTNSEFVEERSRWECVWCTPNRFARHERLLDWP